MSELNTYSLYRHTSPSGKVYIGITKRKPNWRWSNGNGYRRGQPVFAHAIEKYGWENIKHEVMLSNLSEKEAKCFEVIYIALYKNLGLSYNMTAGGDGGVGNRSHLGMKASDETRKKMSISRKGRYTGEQSHMYGKRGDQNPMYGKYGKEHHGYIRPVYQYDLHGNLIKCWDCISDAARALSLIATNICAICRGKGFTLGGYRWSYDYPYIFNPDEARRRKEKREKLSRIAKEGYLSGRRRRRFGSDNPSSKEYKYRNKEIDKI